MPIVAGTPQNDSTVIQTIERPLPAVPMEQIYGDPMYFSRSSTVFTIRIPLTPATGGGIWACTDLCSQPGLTRFMNGRAGAVIDYPLRYSFTVHKDAQAGDVYYAGYVALLADHPSFNLAQATIATITEAGVSSIEGNSAFTGSHLLQGEGTIGRGIGIVDQMLTNQVNGWRPRLVLAGHSSGIRTLNINIQSTVHLSGIGPINPF